jgi:hypothetical protein
MHETFNLEGKISTIRSSFSAVIGAKLIGYETAELLLDDGTWEHWPDLPIRLYTDTQKLIAIAWSKFDDLWIAADDSLPFPIDGSTVRWVRNSIGKINGALGQRIGSVLIGRGEMSVEGRDVEVWTRLLIETGSGWLEVFNALDENGYDFQPRRPTGNFIPCIEQAEVGERQGVSPT